jgi:uncharacterized membrane protein YeaQ/YmgE (transglycosylase-associated protein family)
VNIIRMLVVGLIVGIVARFIYPGPVPMGLIMSAILGIAGSFAAGFIGGVIHKDSADGLHPVGFVYSVLGAMLLIFLARSVFHLV